MDPILASEYGTEPPTLDTGEPVNKIIVDTEYNCVNDIWTPVCRVGMCVLAKAEPPPAMPGRPTGDPKYFVRGLFNPAGMTDIIHATALLLEARFKPLSFGGKEYSVMDRLNLPPLQGGLTAPWSFGDIEYAQDPINKAAYQGLWFMNASDYPTTKKGKPKRPTILNEHGQPVDEQGLPVDPNIIYPGCYARLQVKLRSYDNEGHGVSAVIQAVQFVTKGVRLSSGFDPSKRAAPKFKAMDFRGFAAPEQQQPAFAPPSQAGFQAPPAWQQPPVQQSAVPVMQQQAPAPQLSQQEQFEAWQRAQVQAQQQPAMPQNSAGAPPGYIPGFSR